MALTEIINKNKMMQNSWETLHKWGKKTSEELMYKLYTDELGVTKVMNPLVALIGLPLKQLRLEDMAYVLSATLIIDGIKNWRTENELKKLGVSNVTRAVDNDYFHHIIEEIKKENSIIGELRNIKELFMLDQQGTGIFKSGYINRLELEFDTGESANVLHKYNEKGNTLIGEVLTNALRKKDLNFIPKSYFSGKETRTSWLYSDQVRVNRGSFYEDVGGISLEEITMGHSLETVTGKDIRRFPGLEKQLELPSRLKAIGTTENPNIGVAANIFENLFDVYSDITLIGLKDEKGNLLFTSQEEYLLEIALHIPHQRENVKDKLNYKEGITDRFIERWINSKDGDEETKNLIARLEETYKNLDVIPRTIIHGDLHQGNVLLTESGVKTYIIDWDSAQLGFPYQDFMYFSVLTDFENKGKQPKPDYESTKKEFLERQAEIIPGFTEEHKKLIEFETYTSLLKRYYRAVQKKEIKSESIIWGVNNIETMLQSCKYLLEKSRETLKGYSKLVGNNELEKAYNSYANKKFNKRGAKLDNIKYTPLASIASAHTINHTQKKGQKFYNIDDMITENLLDHQKDMKESITITEGRKAFFTSLPFIGYYEGKMSLFVNGLYKYGIENYDKAFSYVYKNTDMIKDIGSVATLGLLAALGYSRQRIKQNRKN